MLPHINTLFFLPIFAEKALATNVPKIPPTGKREPIQEASSSEIATPKGFSFNLSLYNNFGCTGDVHAIDMPIVAANKFPENWFNKFTFTY